MVLTGQDGVGPEQAHGFTQPAQDCQFGVCTGAAVAPGNPICSVHPGAVPKALDVITPTGVSQADELDPIGHDPATNPVTISGVRIPRGPVRRTPPYPSAPVSRPVAGEQRDDNDDPDLGRLA